MKLLSKISMLFVFLFSTSLAMAGGHIEGGGDPEPDPDPVSGGGDYTGSAGNGPVAPGDVLYWELSFIGIDTDLSDGVAGYTELTNYSGFLSNDLPAVGGISFTNQIDGYDYSADWTVWFPNGYVEETNVICSNNTCNNAFPNGVFGIGDYTTAQAFYDKALVDFTFVTGSGASEQKWLVEYSAVTEVPVPAAAYLFMTALLGLAGVKRNR